MAKIYVVNKEVKGNVVIGNQTLDFTKHVIALDEQKDKELIDKIKSFNESLGYKIYSAKEFKEKFVDPAKEKQGAKNSTKTKEPEKTDENSGKGEGTDSQEGTGSEDTGDNTDKTDDTPDEGTKTEDELTDEQKKAIWKEKQDKVNAQKEVIKKLKAEWDAIPDDAEDAQAQRDAKQVEIDAAQQLLKEIQA